MKTKSIVLSAVLLTGLAHVGPAADNLSEALQKGLLEEEANHNLDAAIQAYQSVVDQFGDQRKIAATAVFRLGECYRKQGKTNEAILQYQRVGREFADQDTLVKLSAQYLSGPGVSATSFEEHLSQILARGSSDEEEKEIQRLKDTLKNSPDLVDAKDASEGRTPLHRAANKGQLALASFLLQAKVDINAKDNQGYAPLHLAALIGNTTMVELLLAHGANASAKIDTDSTPLHLAAGRGYLSVVQALVGKGADVNAKGRYGRSTLHWAANAGYKAVVELLLANSAEVNAPDDAGATALSLAVAQKRAAVVELLLAHEANANTKDQVGVTPLGVAVQINDAAMVKLLLAHGADVNAKGVNVGAVVRPQNLRRGSGPSNQRGAIPGGITMTTPTIIPPLSAAALYGRRDLAELLLENKADVNTADDAGQTPLHWAVRGDKEDMVNLLVAKGANVNAEDSGGFTPWLWAVIDKKEASIKLLLDKGADVNVKSMDGSTGLLQAMSKEPNKDLVQLYLEHNADPNLKGRQGYTALHSAAAWGNIEIAKLLLAKGADVNVRDDTGNTPLHYAALKGMKAMVELLLESKADASITNEPGFTPLRLISDPQIVVQYNQNEWGIPYPMQGLIPPYSPRSMTLQQTAVADLLRQHGVKP